jgi:2-(1,2-epoxy-1,2-dihydrophenyl)acetyl-CoA isomerase
MGVSWLVPRRIGMTRALELALVADRLSAEQALEWGLINQVVDDDALMAAARAAAGKLAALNPRTLALTRRLYWQGLENSLETQLDLESRYQRLRGHFEAIGEPIPESL